MQNLDFYISKNGRYMMLETSIYDRVNNRYADINEISFSDLINIIGKEQYDIEVNNTYLF
jgi:hypothetical protein